MCSENNQFIINMNKKAESVTIYHNHYEVRIFTGMVDQIPTYKYRRLLNIDQNAALNMKYIMD